MFLFDSQIPFGVYVDRGAGKFERAGSTPTKDGKGIAIVEGRAWYVAPTKKGLTDADLGKVARVLQKQVVPGLSLAGQQQITDDGLRHLATLSNLEYLNLCCRKVTDAGLVHLVGLTSLKRLWLRGAKIKGPGLVHVSRIASIEELDLGGLLSLDGKQLVHLEALPQLARLNLW